MQHSNKLSDDAPHILVIDDDTRIRQLLLQYLFKNGFRVSEAHSASDARNKLRGLDFDLLIVDVMMPGEDGISLTQSLSKERNIPIIMLTALSETEKRIDGLEAGADDYLPKPFSPRELVLRIHAILRRFSQTNSPKIAQIVFGPYSYSLTRQELKKGGDIIKLTNREQIILSIFANRANETVERAELAKGANDGDIGERTIDVQINRLRQKIEDDPANPIWLKTVRGIGYRLVIE